jgi:hypothetical protein
VIITYFIIKKYKNIIEEIIHFTSFYLLEFLNSRIKRNSMNANKIKNIVKNVRLDNEE